MESAETKVSPARYVIASVVQRVEERIIKEYTKGFGKDTVFTPKSLGWYVLLAGSYEAIYVGDEVPTLNAGDKVRVTIEKA